jgi:hypothetical protein
VPLRPRVGRPARHGGHSHPARSPAAPVTAAASDLASSPGEAKLRAGGVVPSVNLPQLVAGVPVIIDEEGADKEGDRASGERRPARGQRDNKLVGEQQHAVGPAEGAVPDHPLQRLHSPQDQLHAILNTYYHPQ